MSVIRPWGRAARDAALIAAALAIMLTGQVPWARAAGWPVTLAAGSAGLAAAGTLSAPAGVTGTCGSGPTKSSVIVTWTAVTRAASYTIVQSTTSATTGFTTVATGVTGTSWTSPSLTNGNTYWYKVIAVTGNWSSPASAATAPRSISGNSCS